jgi:hypothetical protein
MQTEKPSPFNFGFLLASGIFFFALVFLWWQDSRQPAPIPLTPTLTNEAEYCLTCHADLPEISASHPVESFGCVICHGGERLALDADLAHSSMRGGSNPSDLSVVEESCGGSECHSGSEADDRHHIQRVKTSIQSTYAGAIMNIRYMFGAQTELAPIFGINSVQDNETRTGVEALAAFDASKEEHPFIQKFGENCLTCHVNAQPREGESYARQTGCSACHTTGKHTLSTAIPYTQCNACHNRGNYDLRTMNFVERSDHPTTRLHDYYQPIAQFTQCEYTLDCVDCHTRDEVMGDGDIHADQQSIQYVQCKTCHGTMDELPRVKKLTDPNDIVFRMSFLNPIMDLKLGDTVIITETGEPLWNTRQLPDGTFEMIGKATKQYFTFKPVMGTACEQKPDEQESHYCHQCHAVER